MHVLCNEPIFLKLTNTYLFLKLIPKLKRKVNSFIIILTYTKFLTQYTHHTSILHTVIILVRSTHCNTTLHNNVSFYKIKLATLHIQPNTRVCTIGFTSAHCYFNQSHTDIVMQIFTPYYNDLVTCKFYFKIQ